ncbi:hypothetical protein RIVM261_076850 [Rivularia sp. IAM M-261]|nr:hypothetical protein RIVM261_076850 [Rivularia sp. IAM M-261]
MNSHILCVDIEASSGNGEDSHLVDDNVNAEFVVLGAFDGLGGRSAGFDGKTGGQIASQQATRIARIVLNQWNGKLTKNIATELQDRICQLLKSQADSKMSKSRLSGTLTGKRLCTTIALASIPKKVDPDTKAFEISLAWMGDSRVYFLSPQKGLQQLTVDDLEIEKDAFQMIREDPRMSQYLTADIPSDWQIHFALENINEKGCVLVCTDGCFQYLPTPWDFEKLLLETLIDSGSPEDWKNLLIGQYEKIKQDDVSLILYPIGFYDFNNLQISYQNRLNILTNSYNTDTSSNNHNDLWNSYRCDYEVRLKTKDCYKYLTESVATIPDNSITETGNFVNEAQSQEIGHEIPVNTFTNNANINVASIPNISTTTTTEFNHSLTIKNLLEQASRYEKSNKLKEAVHQYSDVLDIDANNIEAMFGLGIVYLKLGDYNPAINCFNQLVNKSIMYETEQYYQDSLRWLAQAYFYINDYTEAVIYFDKLKTISQYRNFLDYQLELYAQSLLRVNRYDDTLRVCDNIHYRNQYNPLPYFIKGLIFSRCKKFLDAEHYLKQSLNLYQTQFERTRHQPLRKQIDEVKSEYRKVCEKLNNLDPGRNE